MDRIEQVRRSASGAQRTEFLLKRSERALHAALEIVDVVRSRCHGFLPMAASSRLLATPKATPSAVHDGGAPFTA
jgi:hypothetical protein